MTEPMREDWMRDLLTKSYRPVRPRPAFREGLLEELKERQRRLQADAGRDSETTVSMLLSRCYRPVTAAPAFKAGLRDSLRERQRELVRPRRERRRRVLSFGSGFGLAAAAAVAFALLPTWAGQTQPSGPDPFRDQPVMSAGLVGAPSPSAAEAWQTLGDGVRSYFAMVGDTLRPTPAEPAPQVRMAALRPARIDRDAAGDFAGVVPGRALLAGLEYRPAPDADWQRIDNRDALRLTALADDAEYRAAVCRYIDQNGLVLAPGSECRLPEGDYAANRMLLEDGTVLSLAPGSVCRVEPDGLRLEGGPENGRRHFQVMVPPDAKPLALAFDDRSVAVEPGSLVWVTVPKTSAYAAGGAPAPILEVAPGGLAFVSGPAGVAPLFAEHGYRMDRYVTADVPGWALGVEDERAGLDTRGGDPRMLVAREQTTGGKAMPEGFRYENGRWVDPAYTGDVPAIPVTRLSPEYLSLVRAHRNAADRFALGPNVLIGLGGKFYDIHD